MRRTKIISTFGPSIADPKILKDVCEYADVIRINLAHGTWDESEKYNHKRNIQLIQDTAKKLKKPVAILVDLKGNKIRIGDFKNHMIELENDSDINVIFTQVSKVNDIVFLECKLIYMFLSSNAYKNKGSAVRFCLWPQNE